MEPLLRSVPVLKQEAEELAYQGKVRDTQKMQAQANVELAKITAEAEKKRKSGQELKAKDHASTGVDPPPCNRDAKSPKLPAFIDEKDEICSNRLRFEC